MKKTMTDEHKVKIREAAKIAHDSRKSREIKVLFDDYRIIADSECWMLDRKSDGEKHSWQNVGYYSTLAALIEDIGRDTIKRLPAKTMEDIAKNLKEIKAILRSIRDTLDLSESDGPKLPIMRGV